MTPTPEDHEAAARKAWSCSGCPQVVEQERLPSGWGRTGGRLWCDACIASEAYEPGRENIVGIKTEAVARHEMSAEKLIAEWRRRGPSYFTEDFLALGALIAAALSEAVRMAVEKEREAGKDAAMAAWDAGWAACELFASTHKHRFITDEDGCIWPCQCGAIFQPGSDAQATPAPADALDAARESMAGDEATPTSDVPCVDPRCTICNVLSSPEHGRGTPPETGEKEPSR